METNQNNTADSADKNALPLTPRELIMRHMENPDEPITDDDINNLKLSDEKSGSNSTSLEDPIVLSKKETTEADEFADDLGKNSTGMSYQADL